MNPHPRLVQKEGENCCAAVPTEETRAKRIKTKTQAAGGTQEPR